MKKQLRPCRMLFSNNNQVKRNMWLFDAGLHTQHMKMKKGETDSEFVERFLIKFFEGCRNRGGEDWRYYVMDHRQEDKYITVWGVR